MPDDYKNPNTPDPGLQNPTSDPSPSDATQTPSKDLSLDSNQGASTFNTAQSDQGQSDQTTNQTLSDSQNLTPTPDPTASPSDTPATEPEAVVTAPHAPKKYGGRKIIATIFGILLLIGGVAAGVILVQRQQQIAERAASGSACQQSSNCYLYDNAGNSGSHIAPGTITSVAVTAQDVYTYSPGDTNDGCYHVVIDGTYVSWNRVGSGPSCKDISNVQIKFTNEGPTNTPIPTPPPTVPPGATLTPTQPPKVSAKCLNVKAYDLEWNVLTTETLKSLSAGDKVRFAVAGEATTGNFDKARFTLNNTSLGETTTKKPSSDEFYVEYTIPANIKNFSIKGEVHHIDLGWI